MDQRPPPNTLFGQAYRNDSPEEVKRDAKQMTSDGSRNRGCQAVLDALRSGPKTGMELLEHTGSPRYSARINDLRNQGFDIESQRTSSRNWLYTLKGEPK